MMDKSSRLPEIMAGIVLGLLMGLLLAVSPGFLSEAQTEEHAGVSIVEVPVFVRDKAGKPVHDLRKEEFRVYEDGKAQNLELFLPIDLGKRHESNLPPEIVRRNFVLFFDLTFNTPVGLVRAKEASYRFVDTKLDPEDRVAIFAFSSLKGVFTVSQFTSDKNLLRSAVRSLGLDRKFDVTLDSAGFFTQSLLHPQIQPTPFDAPDARPSTETVAAMEEWMKAMNDASTRKARQYYQNTLSMYLEGMRSFARSLEFFRGRKFLVFFSSGFDTEYLGATTRESIAESGTTRTASESAAVGDFGALGFSGIDTSPGSGRVLSDVMGDALKYFASSDCRVYPIDTGGLRSDSNIGSMTDSTADADGMGRTQASLFPLADETGGKFYKNVSEMDQPLADLVETTGSFYLLGYTPPPRQKSKEGEYHKIKVEILRPGVEFTSRPGYHDPRPFVQLSKEERQLQVAEVISNGLAMEEIRLQAQASAFPETNGRSPVAVMVQMPGDQFAREKRDLLLEIYSFALSSENSFEGYTHGFCKVAASESAGKLRDGGIRYSDVLLLHPGKEYQVRVMVRNDVTGEVGTAQLKVTTRIGPQSFTIATPFFVPQKSTWIDVLGYDPQKPPERVSQLGTEYPLSCHGKPSPFDIYPDPQDGKTRALLVKLYNFSVDPQNKEPDLSLRWEIVDPSGKLLSRPKFKLLEKPNRVSDRRIEYLFDIESEKLPAGPAWLKVTAIDNPSRQSVADWVPLEVR